MTIVANKMRNEKSQVRNTGNLDLINHLFNGWSGSTGAARSSTSSWHSTGHTALIWHSTSSTGPLVQLRDDGVADPLDLLLLVIELFNLGELVSIKPLDC